MSTSVSMRSVGTCVSTCVYILMSLSSGISDSGSPWCCLIITRHMTKYKTTVLKKHMKGEYFKGLFMQCDYEYIYFIGYF